MHDIYRSELENEYDERQQKAEQAKEDERYMDAAHHLEVAAEILEDIAEVEPDETIAEQKLELATSHRESAKQCEQLATTDSEPDPTGSGAGSDDSDPSAESVGGSTGSGRASGSGQPSSDSTETTVADSEWLSPDPGIDFSDVGGMEELKTELQQKIIDPLEHSSLHDQYDLSSANGVILHGESGVGKSFIIKALAGELGEDWVHIGVRPSDIMSSYVGEPAQNLREMFDTAREHAPAIVFIDEIDGLFPPRDTGRSSDNQRQLINEMLIQMIELRDHDVVVVGATNMVDQIDDAVIGRHRFNKVIEVVRPDADAREEILRIHLRDRPTDMETIDFGLMRTETQGMTAADIEELADEAARFALQEAMNASEVVPITQSHLFEALDRIFDGRGSV